MKIQSITGNPINVFEVKVYSSGFNIAESKTADQSSTFNEDNPRFGPENAVDSNENTFSHTNAYNKCSSWWEVDLGGLFSIESIMIINRWCKNPTDPAACLCRLSHVTISLFDDNGQFVESGSIGNTCSKLNVTHDFMRSYCE